MPTTTSRGRFFNVEPTPDNLRAIWDQIHGLRADLAAAQETIETQQATIDDLNEQIGTANTNAERALITAGKTTAATTQSNTGGDSTSTPPPSNHDNKYAVVVAAIADLVANGVNLSGKCGSWTVVNQVVKNLRPSQPDVGLIHKPSGNNCNGYSIDALMYLDGAVYDILIDAENAPATGASPQWSYAGQRPASDWRDPV